MRDVSVQSDEVMLQFGWYAAQSAGQEHEVVHLMADEIVRLREALFSATRVRVLDEWRVLYANGNEGFTRFTPEEAQRVADEDNQNFPGCGARVVRVALVDADASGGNDPENPESSERVSNAYQLPDTVQAIVDAAAAYEKKHGPWQDYRMSRRDEAFPVDKTERAIIVAYRKHTALTAALEAPRP